MDVTVAEEPEPSFQGTRKDVLLPLLATASIVVPKMEQTNSCSSKDGKLDGPPSECTSSAQESEDPLQKGGQQDEEAAVVDTEDISSGLKRDDKKKENVMSTVEQLGEKCKVDNETDLTKSVEGDKEKENREKQLETGEGEHKMKERDEKKGKAGKERKEIDILMGEDERKEAKKGADWEVGEKDLKESKEGDLLLKVDGKEAEQQKKGKGNKNLKKVHESKKEEKENHDKKDAENNAQQEGGKKTQRKEKKSKITSERIKKKIERINAKIGRILAKRDDYVFRLKEAQDKEHQESENAALQGTEASTDAARKSANARSGSGLRREESVILDEFRSQHEAGRVEAGGYMQVERGFSGLLSRTESLVEVPAHLLEKVTGQKESVEDPPDVLESDTIDGNHLLQMEDSEKARTWDGGVINHSLQVASSKESGLSW